MLDHFLVRIRGSELRIRFHTLGQPPGLIPARFPKIGRTGSFRFAERWKKRLGSGFYQESARAKTENGNLFITSSRVVTQNLFIWGHSSVCNVHGGPPWRYRRL